MKAQLKENFSEWEWKVFLLLKKSAVPLPLEAFGAEFQRKMQETSAALELLPPEWLGVLNSRMDGSDAN